MARYLVELLCSCRKGSVHHIENCEALNCAEFNFQKRFRPTMRACWQQICSILPHKPKLALIQILAVHLNWACNNNYQYFSCQCHVLSEYRSLTMTPCENKKKEERRAVSVSYQPLNTRAVAICSRRRVLVSTWTSASYIVRGTSRTGSSVSTNS